MNTTNPVVLSKFNKATEGKGLLFLNSPVTLCEKLDDLLSEVLRNSETINITNTLAETSESKINVIFSELSFDELTPEIKERFDLGVFLAQPITLAAKVYDRAFKAGCLANSAGDSLKDLLEKCQPQSTDADFNSFLSELMSINGGAFWSTQSASLFGGRALDANDSCAALMDELTYVGIYEYFELSLNKLLIGIGCYDELAELAKLLKKTDEYWCKYRLEVEVESEMDNRSFADNILWSHAKSSAIRTIEVMNRRLAEFDYLLRKDLDGNFDAYKSLLN